MQLTIGKKLTFNFLLLVFLVLVSGIDGIILLNKVSRSADTVAKGKAPIQYSVMKADLAVATLEKSIDANIHSFSGLDFQEKNIGEKFDEFEMSMSMLEQGTSSDSFIKSP